MIMPCLMIGFRPDHSLPTSCTHVAPPRTDASTSLVSPPGPASGVKYIAALARKRRRELVSSLRSSVPPAWCQYLADVLLDTGCLDPPPSVADVTAAAAAAAAGEAGAGGTRGLAAAQQQQQQQLLLQQLKVQQHSWLAGAPGAAALQVWRQGTME